MAEQNGAEKASLEQHNSQNDTDQTQEQPVNVEETALGPNRTEVDEENPVNVQETATGGTTEDEDEEDPLKLHWKKSPFAVGIVKEHWSDEIEDGICGGKDLHLRISGLVCGALGAGRIGNFATLRTTKDDPPKIVLVAGYVARYLAGFPLL